MLTPSEALRTEFSQFFPEETDSAQIVADNPPSYFIQSNYGLMQALNENGNLIFNDGSGT
ncbi:MAG: hypothetical protein E7331_07770 [Clostridiales bacterium]|nr:hypothetical protein [Clostridiales bacterium]